MFPILVTFMHAVINSNCVASMHDYACRLKDDDGSGENKMDEGEEELFEQEKSFQVMRKASNSVVRQGNMYFSMLRVTEPWHSKVSGPASVFSP
eukprot:1157619-Pelagomonas_calceolata.AAC.22